MKAKDKCANCGNETNFGRAIGERAKLRWCADCYRYRQRNERTDSNGKMWWRDGPGCSARTPYDGRPDYNRGAED